MPRPGFYNDNEYRAYPFVFQPAQADSQLPQSAIVDAGFIMGIDSGFDPEIHTVWLHAVRRIGSIFEFELRTNAPGAQTTPLVFQRAVNAAEWLTEQVDSAAFVADANSCAQEPAWSGFLVTGPLDALRTALPGNGTWTFAASLFVLEPARIQSLMQGYLRAITVGNLSRAMSQSNCADAADTPRQVIVNKRCLTGDIRFKEGYNAIIRQRAAINELSFTAGRNSGTLPDAELCEHGSEIPFYPNEPKPVLFAATDNAPEVRSKFFSGGPACDELIATINGVGGPNVNFVGGTGVNIVANPLTHSITVELATNAIAGSC